jgi:hypothetical protein
MRNKIPVFIWQIIWKGSARIVEPSLCDSTIESWYHLKMVQRIVLMLSINHDEMVHQRLLPPRQQESWKHQHKQATKTIALRQGFGERYEPFHRGLLDCYFLSETVVPPRPNLFCVTRTDSINESLSSNDTRRPANKFELILNKSLILRVPKRYQKPFRSVCSNCATVFAPHDMETRQHILNKTSGFRGLNPR